MTFSPHLTRVTTLLIVEGERFPIFIKNHSQTDVQHDG